MLLKLSKDLALNNFIQVACLPNSTWIENPTDYPAEDTDSWVAGWGLTSEDGQWSKQLHNVKIKVYNTDVCDTYNQYDTDWSLQMCAGN